MVAHLWMLNINIGSAYHSMIEESKIGNFACDFICLASFSHKFYFSEDAIRLWRVFQFGSGITFFDYFGSGIWFHHDWIVVVLTCSIFAHITMYCWNSLLKLFSLMILMKNRKTSAQSWYNVVLMVGVFAVLSYVWHGKPIFIIISLMLLSVNLADVTKPLSDQ